MLETQQSLRSVRVGYMPLTDCAALVVAAERGFDRHYGIKIELRRESSWAGVRDKLGSGELDAAHVLYGLVYGVQLGVGCVARPMAALMNLSRNGQAITLSNALARLGAHDGVWLAALMRSAPRGYTFAQTFPTGNHAMLLNYWLAAHGIDPLREVRSMTVPPSQMVANLRAGHIDGFCAGEPWGQRAVDEEVGATVATSFEVWPDHPGKVLGTTAAFAERNPDICRALVAAILEAGRWIEACDENREAAIRLLASPAFLNTPEQVIRRPWTGERCVRFHGDGDVNYPWLSDGMWFMTQHRRWGLLKEDPDYLAVAGAVNRVDLYREAAAMAGAPAPSALLRSSTLIDGTTWDGTDPAGYARSFSITHASFSGADAPECGTAAE